MKTAVFSDSHGNAEAMLDAIRTYRPDMIVHLGDGRRDIEAIEREFPYIPVCSVSGNCDRDFPEERYKVIPIGSHKAFITHGHHYGVSYSELSPLLYSAECNDCNIVMFGHTHDALCVDCGGILVINPGSIGRGSPQSWAKLDSDDEGVRCEIVRVSPPAADHDIRFPAASIENYHVAGRN